MRIIILFIAMLACISFASGFQVDTMSYSVKSTNTGLSGSNLDTVSYGARFYFEPFYPASIAETSFYWLHPGYFESITGLSQIMQISLISPGNNAYFNSNVTFDYNVTTNGTIAGCNLLVYQNASLMINDSDVPLDYVLGPYSLPENVYTWRIDCSNSLGNISSSIQNTFTIDYTPPVATIITPLNNATPYNNFTINVNEINPAYVVIGVNGTDYVLNYTNGLNVLTPNLPIGYYSYNMTFYDLANNSAVYGPFNIYVNNNPVNISNVAFDPIIPLVNVYDTLSAKIIGTFSNVTVSIFTNSTGWTNHSVYLNTGNNYYYVEDGILLNYGQTLKQQWFVLDSTNVWRHSGIYSVVISKRSGTDIGPNQTISEPIYSLSSNISINPSPIQIQNLQGAIFEVRNNNAYACELINVHVANIIGDANIQDRFNVQTLDTTNLTIAPNSSISLVMKPSGIRGIVGNGMIYADTKNCGQATANLGVQIYFTDIIIDSINKFTSDVTTWVNGIIGG